MNKLEKKQKEFDRLKMELMGLQKEHQDKCEKPKFEKYIGTYWKFKNYYSCPEKESDYWWLYRYLKRLASDRFLLVENN